MTIEQYRPKEYYLKSYFRKNKVPQLLLARALNCSYQKINQILNGWITAKPEDEKKLRGVAREIYLRKLRRRGTVRRLHNYSSIELSEHAQQVQ